MLSFIKILSTIPIYLQCLRKCNEGLLEVFKTFLEVFQMLEIILGKPEINANADLKRHHLIDHESFQLSIIFLKTFKKTLRHFICHRLLHYIEKKGD